MKNLLMVVFGVIIFCLFLMIVVGEEDFQILCQVPHIESLVSYSYYNEEIADIQTAQNLLDKHFPDIVVKSSKEFEGHYSFYDESDRHIGIFRDGVIHVREGEWLTYGPIDGKFDFGKLEEIAKEYLRKHGFETANLYRFSVGGMVRRGDNIQEQKSGPTYTFGWEFNDIPIIPTRGNQVSVYFDYNENIVMISYQKSKMVQNGNTTEIISLEESLRLIKKEIMSRQLDISKDVIDCSIAYYGKDGSLVPCWWVTTEKKGPKSVKGILIDAQKGTLIGISSRYTD